MLCYLFKKTFTIMITKKKTKTVATKEVKETPLFEKKEMLININWKKIPAGTKFEASIDGTLCKGRIQKESNSIYFCQDKIDGAECKNKLGYKYSWSKTSVDVVHELILDPDFVVKALKKIKIAEGRIATIYNGHIEVGCTTITNAKVREVAKALID